MKAVVLVSGGLDSATTLAIAQREGFDVHALSFRYGQRHAVELDAAARVVAAAKVAEHVVATIDLRLFGGSALTQELDVPHHARVEDLPPGDRGGVPITYVPARNTIFLSFALAWAEVLDAHHVFLGVNALDYSGYPDCRPEYIEAYQRMANLATQSALSGGVAIRTPLIDLTKSEIIALGRGLGVDYGLTHSCYDPDPEGRACGMCDSCLLRLRGFAQLGLTDPALVAS